jgi:hypothetical protein
VTTRTAAATSVSLDGDGIRLTADGLPPESAKIVACVRPDDVTVRPGDSASSDNSMSGDVLLASFIGSHMQYRVKVRDNIVWEVLSTDVRADIRVGSRVTLSVEPRNVLLLPRE